MKRRSSSAPGGVGSVRGRSRPVLLGTLLFALAACGEATSTSPPTEISQPPSAVPATAGAPTGSPATDPGSESPTEAPPATQAPEPATPEPSATLGPEPTNGTGSVASCSGSDENRDFFASMAAAVDWTVYCPVLGDGWFVDDGRYRLAGGGWLEIGYDGPGNARLILRQGAFCPSADGCVPAGQEIGQIAFGDRTGALIAADDGTWSVAVDRGSKPSWLLVVDGLGQAAVRTIAANLRAVAG